MEKRQQAIALCRVSSDEQLKNNSLNRQNAAVQKIAEEHNLDIIKIWSHSVSSKRGNNTKRKDLQEMLEFCRNHKRVKYLIIDEPDRFMRSMYEAASFEVEFSELGVTLLFSDPKYNGDTSIARLQKILGYYGAEVSNEERQRKSIKGCEAAIKDGRYPFPIKLGYKKGPTPAVAVIDTVVGPLLKEQLIRIAKGISSPTVALSDFNHNIELAGVKKAPIKMDKWRHICTDPYYCGVVEMHKSVNASNPNGLHEKLISKPTHDKIVEAFYGKPKNQHGPNTTGNPLYPFNKMITHTDCPRTKTIYNTLVGVTANNGHGKTYQIYRCRGCHMSLSRKEVHEKIGSEISLLELTEGGRRALDDAIGAVFEQEDEVIEAAIVKLRSQKKNAEKESLRLKRVCSEEPLGPLRDSFRRDWEDNEDRIRKYDEEIDKLGEEGAAELDLFCKFALDFINNLVHRVLSLSPHEMQLCKQLLFPNGFFIDDNKNIYTPFTSPIYRLNLTKNDSFESKNSLMVRVKRL